MQFQEIVQNADDAGARRVKFMLDETHYGQESLLPTEAGLGNYQVTMHQDMSMSLHVISKFLIDKQGLSQGCSCSPLPVGSCITC